MATDETIRSLPEACSSEAAAVEFIEHQRWGNEPNCPRCGSFAVRKMVDSKTGQRNKRWLWRCADCQGQNQFTVRIGTVLEDSRIAHRHWCYAFWAACASKKGVSALQIHRMTGVSYKSALFLMHRIRFALADDPATPAKLDGTVEVDESYIGGKPRYKLRGKRGRGTKQQPIIALVQRDGKARARVIDKVTAANASRFVLENINTNARLITDEAWHYTKVGRKFPGGHWTVNHSKGEYVRGEIYSNTIEGFFSLVKRGIYGTFHSVSRHHLYRYLDEFCYRYNTRKMTDGQRVTAAIKNAQGKRLQYREPLAARKSLDI